jgi:hypothetical protein
MNLMERELILEYMVTLTLLVLHNVFLLNSEMVLLLYINAEC